MLLSTSRTWAIICFQDLAVLLCPSCFHLFLHSWSLLLTPKALSSGLPALTMLPEGSRSAVIQPIVFGSGTWPGGQRLLLSAWGCRAPWWPHEGGRECRSGCREQWDHPPSISFLSCSYCKSSLSGHRGCIDLDVTTSFWWTGGSHSSEYPGLAQGVPQSVCPHWRVSDVLLSTAHFCASHCVTKAMLQGESKAKDREMGFYHFQP